LPANASIVTAGAAFAPRELRLLERRILSSPQLASDHLNRDFVGTRGFSVVFTAAGRGAAERAFPYFARYLELALDPACNAFYLNPLAMGAGSRVDPHVDRSLRGYVKEIGTPYRVSVLYVAVPPGMRGGRLVLARGRRELARIAPRAGKLVTFDGDLTHSIERVELAAPGGTRLSLVCEQYRLADDELERIPEFRVETGGRRYGSKSGTAKSGTA
jgi:hypothetical protein